MMTRFLTLLIIFLFNISNVKAQTGDYKAEWKKIDDLEKKGLTKDALKATLIIFNDAVAKGNEAQQVKAAMYQMKYRNMTEEENNQKNIFFVDTLIAKAKAPAKNILLSMQAQLFQTYKENNRYKFYGRTALTEEKGNDISTWSLTKLNEKISSLYKASLQNETLLKATGLKGFEAIIEKGENTENLRPTLYDFLAHRALDYFMSTENDISSPAYKFIINDEKAFSPVPEFISHRFITKDTASLYFNALLIMQELLRFHAKDLQPDALLDADLKRLAFVNEHGVFNNKDRLYEAALLNIEMKYSNNPASAQASYLRAHLHMQKGNLYKPLLGNEHQFEFVTAKQICEAAYAKFPKSEGGINCKNLITEIERPGIHFETEKVNVPGQPFRTLVQFKNTARVYFRVVKTDREQVKKIEQGNDHDRVWPSILALKPIKSWSQDLPDQKDHQQHAAEAKIDALAPGTYYLLMSRNEDFSLSNNIIGKTVTFISNISYLTNNKNEVYAMERESGAPLDKATIQLWANSYNYSSRKYEEILRSSYVTDKNGYAKIPRSVNSENYLLQVKHGNDELFTDDGYNSYYYNDSENRRKGTKRTFFFTDRSIYRPRQTVFFKGIMTQTDSSGRKSEPVPDKKSSVQLFDNNNQKQGSVNVITNSYGSYNGNFILPGGLLNGNFYILDTVTQSRQYFSVEEYKRPKFSAEIKKPAGTYRINDSIKVTGLAKAYAGNNIDGAKVSYRVVRIVRYPIWFNYYRSIYPPRGNEEMEITNGITTTNAKGEFTVTFRAIPDETIDKKNQPIFEYRVTADVTDNIGETRTATTVVAVSYQALQLNIITGEKIAADSIINIGISSTNANGIFEKARVNFSMYKLQEPNRVFRKRYWERPDVFVMNRSEYYNSFPYDAYADEYEMSKWALGQKVIDVTDTTSKDSKFKVEGSGLAAGWYKIIVTTKDKFGEEVKAEKFLQVTSALTAGKDVPGIRDPILINAEKKTGLPGEKINYDISTGYDKIWLIQNIIRHNNNYSITYPTVSAGETFSNTIDITENDRGGINMNYAFIKHNRIYSGAENFAVPWSNKELQISYETFRDKLQPGSEEKWTIKITGNNAEKVAAETLVSMYDASLDQFKPHQWSSLSSLWPRLVSNFNWTGNTFRSTESQENNTIGVKYLEGKDKSYDELADNGWNEDYNNNPRFMDRTAAPSSSANAELQSVVVSGNNMKIKAKEGNADSQKIVLRGLSSITGDNSSLFIVDGVVVPSAGLNQLNPNDIEKIDILKGEEAARLFGAKGINGAIVITTKGGAKLQPQPEVKLRKNFNETAFFFPSLVTDADGNVAFSFTIPEALTQWKLMVMAHNKDLASAYSSKTTVTQKELMVQPNAPRFLREGDRMEFSAKIVNLTDKEITGRSSLELLDAATNKPVDGWFKNIFPQQYFTVPAGQSVAVKFPIDIPFNFNSAMTYRIKAVSSSPLGGGREGADGSFSDGEEAAIPVLTNRMLVTETLPLNMRNTNSKTFTFGKLLNSANSGSLTNHALTVEYTSNPAWYAVQALPYLMEYPYDCAEQNFNRYYANTLAANIANSNPKIKAVFEKWLKAPSLKERAGGEVDTAALMSNLQKNEELKSVLLQETPWVLQAQNETAQKKNIALLFDMVRLAGEQNRSLAKLKEMQSSNGGFAWFKGGRDDRYMTQYIITGIGHLRKLNAVQGTDYAALKPIVDKALPYLDARLKEEYDNLVRYKADLSKNNLSYIAIQYLYMRSFFPETSISSNAKKAADYYEGQAKKFWLSQTKYMQAMIGLALHRNGDSKIPKAIIESLKQNSIISEEMGMYWKEFNKSGYYWHQAPIESQAMMIEAFTDIDKNIATVNDLKTWLLKQKQTQQWPTTKATAEACYALLLTGSDWLAEERTVTISLGNTIIKSTDEKSESGTGYFKKRIEGDKVQQGMGNITVALSAANNQPLNATSTSWGAAYWQYFEDLDKITAAETPLKLVKKLFIEKNSDKGPVLQAIKDGDELKVGDKIKVRIELRSDRDMEYIHMKDMRAACMEPVNVISQYKYQGGLGYYESTKDASTNFFFGWLPKGSYVFEYPMFVTHNGNFSNGITTIQCMYAPEFTSHSEGVRVSVGE